MSIDQELRQAATATYKTVGQPDVEAALHTFHATRRRRQRSRRVGALASLAAAVLAGGLAVAGPWSQPGALTDPAPASRGGEAPQFRDTVPPEAQSGCGGNEAVQCVRAGSVVVDGRVRYAFSAPRSTWSAPDVLSAPEIVDVYQRERDAGVAFLVNPRAARTSRVITSASELAHWVAHRPFVKPTTAERTQVDGLPAWRVDVEVRAGGEWRYDDSCNDVTVYCKPLLHQPYGGMGRETGPWRGMVSRYTFVDVPGQKPLVIWSWTKEPDAAEALEANADLVRTIDILEGD